MLSRWILILGIVGISLLGLGMFLNSQWERVDRDALDRSVSRTGRLLSAKLEKDDSHVTEQMAEMLAGSRLSASYHDAAGRVLALYPVPGQAERAHEEKALEASIKPFLIHPTGPPMGKPADRGGEVMLLRSVSWSGDRPRTWLRVAADLAPIKAVHTRNWRAVWGTILGAWSLIALIGANQERTWRKSIADLSRALNSLEQGKPSRPVGPEVVGPIHPLALVFDSVFPRLEDRISQLQRDSQQLRAVLSGMAEGVMAVDSRRRLLFANPSAYRMFGLDGASVGRLAPELIRSPQFQQVVEATLAGPDPYRGEISMASQEELPRVQARVLAVQGTPLPGTPPSAAVLVFHDVTDLRRLERMRQDFVANASHELKTPLASIKAYTETLLDWGLKDDSVNVRFLKQIDEQSDRLNQLVLDLLSLARLESNPEAFHHEPLEIFNVVKDCVDGLRGRAEAKALRFGVDEPPLGSESVVVNADEEAIRQILDNLIDNAIKYTPEGGSVRVACRLAEDREGVVLEVMDSGIGIPRDDLPRIFERFYRVDKARSRELGGTGLGLSIVKHLVQSLSGEITVSSRLGSGSRFTVRLPRHHEFAAT